LILLAHMLGDYVAQSHWMATEKTRRWLPAALHAATYTACYLMVTRSVPALAVIGVTHAVIDRYRLARYVVWAKNQLAPRSSRRPWPECSATGYPTEVPAWLSVWLMIAADNIIHLSINLTAVMWL
jgi:hypothetical protein